MLASPLADSKNEHGQEPVKYNACKCRISDESDSYTHSFKKLKHRALTCRLRKKSCTSAPVAKCHMSVVCAAHGRT